MAILTNGEKTIKAGGRILEVPESVSYNANAMRVSAGESKTVTPSFIMLNSDRMTLITPSQGKITGISFSFPVTVGDVVVMYPESGDWNNMERIEFANDKFIISIIDSHLYIKNAKEIELSNCTVEDSITGLNFPNCIHFTGGNFDSQLSGVISAATFNKGIEHLNINNYRTISGIKYCDFDTTLFNYYDSLKTLLCNSLTGDFSSIVPSNIAILNELTLSYDRQEKATGDAAADLFNKLDGLLNTLLVTVSVRYATLTPLIFSGKQYSGLNFSGSRDIDFAELAGVTTSCVMTAIEGSVNGVLSPMLIKTHSQVWVYSNYDLSGNLDNLADQEQEIRIHKTGVTELSTVAEFKALTIYWYDCTTDGRINDSDITELSLINLLSGVVSAGKSNVIVSIGSFNPPITDAGALADIAIIQSRGGTVVYNT